ncbi:unnamed protein product [Somion occarium]|uniref:AB hydrolase-1 domain-containing protein n=1 Tax=Somion occarium TaxID=3059160 RepID=A0ABP1DZW0_9APHY
MKWSSDILLSRSSFVIPRPGVAGVRLTGVLEHVIPDHSAGRRLALIIHGAVGYNLLARCLPLHSFCFDCRGNHESSGQTSSVLTEAADLQVVYDYMTMKLGYIIDLIVAHSRGAISSFIWICTSPDAERNG